MRARRKLRGPAVSLFPFLSVLAVVIGTLTMIITGISLGEITADTLPKPGEFARIPDSDHPDAALGRLRELRSSLAVLGEREQEVRRSLELVRRRVADKETELAAVKGKKEEEPERRMLPYQGSGRGRSPLFVECGADGLVLNAQAGKEARTLVPPEGIESSAALASLLRDVKSHESGLIVFVIRPGGVPLFDRARAIVRESGAPCGYMAAPGHLELDYSLYAVPR